MTTPEELGMVRPVGTDWISQGDDAISQNASATAEMYDLLAASINDAAVQEPLGLSVDLNTVKKPGLYPVRFGGNPNGVGWAGFLLVGQSYNGTLEQVTQLMMTQPNGLYFRAGRDDVWRDWDQMATMEQLEAVAGLNTTRRVLHQLSFPGNGNLRDSAPTRHVRVPLKLNATVHKWDLTIKNFNEQLSNNYGDLEFVDVYIGKALKSGNGQYTQNYDGAPTNIGTLSVTGSGATRRYMLTDIEFTIEKGEEYLLSYGYTDPNPEVPNHMGIGGAWLGTDPSMVGRYDPPVSNSWSPNIPLDVYLTLHASDSIPVYFYFDSSSGTGLGSDNPRRDVWCWRHAEANGALPVILGHSGSTIASWKNPSRYTWAKLSSTFDHGDRAFVAVGSNDVNISPDVPTMISDMADLTKLVRENAAESITYVNVFPRRTESPEVKAARNQWNAHLATLPNGAIQTIDRVAAVSGYNGLMRPELDSGDGTHLNTAGQAYLGQAAITGQTFERVDTGERDISSLFTAGGTHGGFTLRRVGQICTLTLYNWSPPSNGSGVIALLPIGFRPAVTYGVPAQGLSSRIQVTSAGNVQAYNWTSAASVVASIVWATSDPWPATLPGTAL